MRIVNFAVDNFRGISGGLHNNRIDFQGIDTLFLFGQNNAGKSTFLLAYDYFFRDTKPTSDDYHHKNQANVISFEIEVELDAWDRNRIETAAPNAKESYQGYLIDGARLRLRSEWSSGQKTALTWKPDSARFEKIGYASVGLHQVFQSCLPRPIRIKAMPTEEDAKNILNEILKAMAESKLAEKELAELEAAREKIRELQERMYRKDVIDGYRDAVNAHVAALFPGVRIAIAERKERLAWTENKLGREHDIAFESVDDSGASDPSIPDRADMLGHGTIRTAIFTLLLMRDIAEEFERVEGRKDYLVLFEEPELFLYPKVVRELRELMYRVSEGSTPYQVLCASHSPTMIDITKVKSSIVRIVKEGTSTKLHQVTDSFLRSVKGAVTDDDFRQEMYEILRFNPYVCESFYADEVILVEGPTEEILLRAYLQALPPRRFFFVLNCGTVNNIPFYQKVLSQFRIPYSVVCDTDAAVSTGDDGKGNPLFDSGIQKSISDQFQADAGVGIARVLRTHAPTFEPAHRAPSIPEGLRMPAASAKGKPFDANQYWRGVLLPNLGGVEIGCVPIIATMREIAGSADASRCVAG